MGDLYVHRKSEAKYTVSFFDLFDDYDMTRYYDD